MTLDESKNLKEIVSKVDLTLINEQSLDREVQGMYVGDLLSMVLGKADEQFLWITVQTHVNAIAIAQMLDFSGIIFVEGLMPDDEAISKANELDLPLFSTKDDAYTLIRKLTAAGI